MRLNLSTLKLNSVGKNISLNSKDFSRKRKLKEKMKNAEEESKLIFCPLVHQYAVDLSLKTIKLFKTWKLNKDNFLSTDLFTLSTNAQI